MVFPAEIPLSNASVPLLMPLLTLMERPGVTFDGMDVWENNDQGCEIMFRHLEGARAVARNADTYTCNAQRILQGKPRTLQVISGGICGALLGELVSKTH